MKRLIRRCITLALPLVVVASSLISPVSAEPRGILRTPVIGGWEGSPPAFPTSIDPDTGEFTVVGHAIFNGSWVGASIFHMTGTIDLGTGDYVATAETEFTGTWVEKSSTGTLTWHEEMTGNFITGEFDGTIKILSGSGDPYFRCSTGKLEWSGYANALASYGGYSGTWVHGCAKDIGK